LRGFIALLLLAVVILSGYMYLRVSRMEQDVAHLKAVLLKTRPMNEVGKGDPQALLSEAIASSRRARGYLDHGETKKAKRELSVTIQKLTEASKTSQGYGFDGKELTNSWKQVTKEMEKLWKQFAAEKSK
jgi:hypothetical protein